MTLFLVDTKSSSRLYRSEQNAFHDVILVHWFVMEFQKRVPASIDLRVT